MQEAKAITTHMGKYLPAETALEMSGLLLRRTSPQTATLSAGCVSGSLCTVPETEATRPSDHTATAFHGQHHGHSSGQLGDLLTLGSSVPDGNHGAGSSAKWLLAFGAGRAHGSKGSNNVPASGGKSGGDGNSVPLKPLPGLLLPRRSVACAKPPGNSAGGVVDSDRSLSRVSAGSVMPTRAMGGPPAFFMMPVPELGRDDQVQSQV
jgi:hypothetical protein